MVGVRLIDFASRFGLKTEPARHVLIIGGGRIGERLAGKLEKDDIKTRIIESDIRRCRYLYEKISLSLYRLPDFRMICKGMQELVGMHFHP